MKHMFNSLIALIIAGMFYGCNGSSNKEDARDDSSSTSSTAITESTERWPETPFDIFIIYHPVKDYTIWRNAFDADSSARAESGLRTLAVERSADNPNNVKIVLIASDLAKAKTFAADERLKEVMGKAGVTSKPDMQYWKVVRFSNQKPGSSRVQIVHKVKDYDSWIKVYDAEGAATRAANGLVEIGVARGIDDPNLLHIAFDVTDMAKAKARLSDPALKKLMTDAGVVGEPSIVFYNDATR